MHNDYAKVIDLLMDDKLDFRKISTELAKKYPQIFIEMASANQPIPEWCREVIKFMRAVNKIDAIKCVRAATGVGLKEAKDICDTLCWDLYHKETWRTRPVYDVPDLDIECSNIYHKIRLAL